MRNNNERKKGSFAKKNPKLAKVIGYVAMAALGAVASNTDRIVDRYSTGGDADFPKQEVYGDTTNVRTGKDTEIIDTTNAQKVAEMVRIVNDKKVHCNFKTHDGWIYGISSYGNGIMITLDKDGGESQNCHFTIDSIGTLTDFYGKVDGAEVSVHGGHQSYFIGDKFYYVDENPKLKAALEKKLKQCEAAFQDYYTILKAKEARLPEVNEENKKMCTTIMDIVREHCDEKGYVVFTSKGCKYSLWVPKEKDMLSVWKRPVGTTSQETCDSWSYDPNGNIQFIGFNKGKDLFIYGPDYVVDDWEIIGGSKIKRALTEAEKTKAETKKDQFQNELGGVLKILNDKYSK